MRVYYTSVIALLVDAAIKVRTIVKTITIAAMLLMSVYLNQKSYVTNINFMFIINSSRGSHAHSVKAP